MTRYVNSVLAYAHDHIKITTEQQNNHHREFLKSSRTEVL